MSFAQTIAAERRRDILRILMQAAPRFAANNRVIHRGLEVDCQFPPSLDQVNADLAWLAEIDLITSEKMVDGKTVLATLKQRGKDAANGYAIIPGIAEPEPAA